MDNTIYKCGQCGKKVSSKGEDGMEEMLYAWKCKCGADRDTIQVSVDPSRYVKRRV